MSKVTEEFLFTGCRDCGNLITHNHPLSKTGKIDFYEKYADQFITIYYDFPTKHYLGVIHSKQERWFMCCSQTLEQLAQDKEINKILKWAGALELVL